MASYFPLQSNPVLHRTAFFSSYNNLQDQQFTSTATIKQTKIPGSNAYAVKFKTLGACELGISRYPDFQYDADGGAGIGIAELVPENGQVSVDFDVKQLYIPPLSSATTKFLGLPLPPFLKIDVVPEEFRGTINRVSGMVVVAKNSSYSLLNAQAVVSGLSFQVDLRFRSKFWFSVGSLYKPPPLLVETILTSEESKGEIRGGRGQRLGKDDKCKLVGVATVEPIDDVFMNAFLGLPTECLAVLNASISFSSTE